MELFRVYICIFVYLTTQVYGRPMELQDKCWRLRGTSYKLCIEEDEAVIMSAKRTPIAVLRQIFEYPVSDGKSVRTQDGPEYSAYSGGQKLFASDKKPASDETYIEKRPFDSISYNTGLGGFK